MTAVKEGDIIKINFTGALKENGKVFDTSHEDVARKEGIFRENVRYAPQPVITGQGFIIKGVDEQLVGMKVGDKREFIVGAEKAFGNRNDEMIKVVPLKEFRDRGITPYPGLVINFGGTLGKIKSVSGGRVTVDFNSDLAGRDVVYNVEIVKKAETLEERIDMLLALCFPYPEYQKAELKNKELFLQLSPNLYADARAISMKQRFVNLAFVYLDGVSRVCFLENYVKKMPEHDPRVRRIIDVTPAVEELKAGQKQTPRIDLAPEDMSKDGRKEGKTGEKPKKGR